MPAFIDTQAYHGAERLAGDDLRILRDPLGGRLVLRMRGGAGEDRS